MKRAIFGVMLFGLFWALPVGSIADAGPISPNNPYRSFNISGVNYASMQWERKHGNKASKNWSNGRSSGRWFRRR